MCDQDHFDDDLKEFEAGGMVTRVGNGSLFMANAHVGHDCEVGDTVVLANSAALAGHVVVEAHAIIGGLGGVHQFTRVGESATRPR